MTQQEATGPAPARRIERVLIVAPQPFYEDRGTPIAVAQLAAALSALGADIDLLTYPVGRDVPLARLRVRRCPNPLRFRMVPVGISWRKMLLDLLMMWPLVRLLARNDYDLVHVLEEMAPPTILLCRRQGLPVVYDMQSSIPEQLRSHALFGTRPAQALLRRLEAWQVRQADAVVCSAGLLDHVRSLAPAALAIEWRFTGQEVEAEAKDPAARRAQLGLEPGARLVVYSGTFEPYQGLELLIAAMPRVLEAFPETVLLLIGATGDDAVGEAELVAGLLRQHRLKVLPRQPRGDIPAYLALADVLVSPRAYGGNVPLKIFDYVLSGKPIVATDIRAHRSLLNDETAVLVPTSAAGMAAGIVRLLGDPELGARLAGRARQVAGRDPKGRSFAQTVQALYLDAMNRREIPSRQDVAGGPTP